jgi:hypothetical protein
LERNEFLKNRIRPIEEQRIIDQVNNKTIPAGVTQYQLESKIMTNEEHRPPQRKMINVFGEEEPDPICNYLGCNHAFSLHTNRNNHCKGTCSCQHPQNSVIGLSESI